MINRRAKGARTELRAQRELEAAGYLVARAPPGSAFQHHDFFELFDLIAIDTREIRMIQVTSGSSVGVKTRLIDSRESRLPCILGVVYEVWQWRGRRGWRYLKRGGGPSKWTDSTKCLPAPGTG